MTTNAGPAKKSIDTADSILPTKHRQARYILPVVHAGLYLAMWAFYAVSHWGLADGLPGVFFAILMVVDLPFSFYAFGVIFQGGRDATIAVYAWGLGGTLWWFLIGLAIDAMRSYLRKADAE